MLCNSWQSHAKPAPPCQWLEEALVEAFSVRGLGRLTENWRTAPPFPDDSGYADSIAKYRVDWVDKFTRVASERGYLPDFGGWFHTRTGKPLKRSTGLIHKPLPW